MISPKMPELIDGLPDAIAIRCIARVPYVLLRELELVSRSWRHAIRSSEFLRARIEVGASSELICVSAFDPENLWQLYDPQRDLWLTVPVIPSRIRHLAHYGVVSLPGKLYVLGGGSDAVDPLTGDQDGSFATNEVWSYDAIQRNWSPRAGMMIPRAMFACGVLNGRIVAAGGFTNCRKSVAQAEVYDPDKDTWTAIGDLPRVHASACYGSVIDGRFHVFHKALAGVQVMGRVKEGWRVEECAWPQGPMAVAGGGVCVMSHGSVLRLEGDTWRAVASASEFRRRIGFAMVGVGDDVYVLGGVIGPDQWNWDIKALSDVDVLPLGGDRRNWRRAASMTRCRGPILGCTLMRV